MNTLRRRGRRRLVGAIALVLLAAIVLPMVFDVEPEPSAPPVSVRIPGEEDTRFSPAPESAPRAAEPAPPKPAPAPAPESARMTAPAPKSTPAATPPEAPRAAAKPATPPEPKAAEKPAAPQPAAGAPAGAPAEQFVVPVAALASQAKVRELVGKLKGARLPYYTEPLATAKGPVTRIRAGPFATLEAAEEAQKKLTRLGLRPGKTLPKS